MVHNLVARIAPQVVDCGGVDQKVELKRRTIAQELESMQRVVSGDRDRRIAGTGMRVDDRRSEHLLRSREQFVGRQSHSSAPFRQMYSKPMLRMPMNTAISANPNHPSLRNCTAQGYMNTTSTSKMMKRIAVR